MTSKCYSYNGEDYNYDSLYDAIDMGALMPGDTVYIADSEPITAKHIVSGYSIIEQIGETAYDEFGECAYDYLTNVPNSDVEELENLVAEWIEKNHPPHFYRVKNIVEHKVTQEEWDETIRAQGDFNEALL